jgi:hypothetical protein
VLYTSYKANRDARDLIISAAQRVLKPVIAEVGGHFHVARSASFERPANGLAFDVGLYCGFHDLLGYRTYMEHPSHLTWCRFVLRGWKLAGSCAANTKSEFLEYILSPRRNGELIKREGDSTPDSEVVWDGEQVLDFGDLETSLAYSARAAGR